MSDSKEQQKDADVTACPSRSYAIGDFVYSDAGGGIGVITDANCGDDGKMYYRINYCQGKDLASGVSGGNGPIWRDGYPKQVTEPRDVLFVAAMKEKFRIANLKKSLADAESNFSALKRARELLE